MARYSKRTLQSAVAATGNGNNLIVEGYGAAGLQITGTFVGTVTFEGTVNETSSTWVAIRGVNRNTGAASTTADDAGIWVFNATGLYAIRARVSAYTSGNITVVGREVDPATAPGELPAAVSNLVTLQDAVTANGDGTALDVLGFGTAALQVSGTFSATVTFETTTDGTNWISIYGDNQANAAKITSTTGTGIYFFNVAGRAQIRARVSTYASGNVTVKGYATALTTPTSYVSVTGAVTATSTSTGNVAHGAADSGNPVKIGGTATAAAPAAVDEGDRVNASFTLAGSQRVEVTAIAAGDTNIGNVDLASAIPTGANVIGKVSIDQTTPGTTNLVQIGSTLPAFTAIPAVKIDQTTVGTTDHVTPTGAVAHDAVNTANPILTGFVAESTIPTAVADGDLSQDAGTLYGARFVNPVTSAGAQVTGATGAAVPAGAMQVGGIDNGGLLQPIKVESNTAPNLRVGIFNGTSQVTVHTAPGDAEGNFNHLGVLSRAQRYNNSTWDRERNNTAQTALASAQRTATTNSSDLTLYNEPGADFIINISSINAGTPSITVAIQVKDNISSNYVTVLTSAALNSVATTRLRVYPGITAAANVAVSDILRRTIRVSVTHADAQAIDYSISMGSLTA